MPGWAIITTIISCDGSYRTECRPAQFEHNAYVVLVVVVMMIKSDIWWW